MGGSGRAGSYVIPELVEHGHEAVSVDLVRGRGDAPYTKADLTDYGQTVSALRGAEAVVHLGAISNPDHDTPEVVFSTNVVSTWNVLQAAELLGIGKLVLASSIAAVDSHLSRRIVPPPHFPVDEEVPTAAEEAYQLSKWVGEQVADGFARRRSVQISSLRFHGLRSDDDLMAEFKANRRTDPNQEARVFWGYVHLKDAARACRMSVEADWEGHEVFFITAGDTVLSIPTE